MFAPALIRQDGSTAITAAALAPAPAKPPLAKKAPTSPLSRSQLAQEALQALGPVLAASITPDALAGLLRAIVDGLDLTGCKTRSSQRDRRDAAIRKHKQLGPMFRRAVKAHMTACRKAQNTSLGRQSIVPSDDLTNDLPQSADLDPTHH